MKVEIVEFMTRCFVCQQVNAKHQRQTSTLKPLEVIEWKLDKIIIDFVMGLPIAVKYYDNI